MVTKNEIISQHYVKNYDRLVKRTKWRAPNQSPALAEECVQEAYARALKYFPTYDEKKDTFEKWFEGILRNALNDCRKIEKDRGVSGEMTDGDGVVLHPSRREKMMAVMVIRDIKEDANRLVLSMFLIYGYKTKDIAEYTGMSHTNVRQIIYRFRTNMSEFFKITSN